MASLSLLPFWGINHHQHREFLIKKKTENWKRETGNTNSKMEKPETINRYWLWELLNLKNLGLMFCCGILFLKTFHLDHEQSCTIPDNPMLSRQSLAIPGNPMLSTAILYFLEQSLAIICYPILSYPEQSCAISTNPVLSQPFLCYHNLYSLVRNSPGK